MKKNRLFPQITASGSRLVAVAACSLTVSLTGAFAQSSEEEVVELGDDVITGQYLYSDQVSALKTPTPIIDVPQSLSIVTEEQMEQRGVKSIGEVIDYLPGVTMSQGEGHRDAVIFRGVRSTSDFYVDGMRDDMQYYRSLYNVEQVEVLRGPNALLFGRGGTGGLLNRVTKKGVLGETFTGYQAGVDTFGEVSLSLDTNHAVSDNAALRLNLLYDNLDNHRDFYDGERFGATPSLRLALSEDTTLDLTYEYADNKRFIDRGVPTGADGEPVERFEDIIFGDPEENFSTFKAHTLRAALDHRFSDSLKGRLGAFYGNYDKVYQNFYVSGYDEVNSPNVVTLDGYRDTTQRETMMLQGDLIGEFDALGLGHTLVTGIELVHTDNDNDRFNSFWDQTNDDNEVFTVQEPLALRGGVGTNASGNTTTNDFTVDRNDKTEAEVTTYSVYLQDEIEVTDWFDVVLGARFDHFKIDVNDIENGVRRSRTDEEISPRAGLIFKPMEELSIYGSYSKSFLPRSGEQYASISATTEDLDPDEFTNLEIGIKWDFVEGMSFTAALFQIEQSSPQPQDNNPATVSEIETETDGFELQLEGMLTDKWYISAGYTYLDGEQVNANGAGSGLRPRELPEHAFSVWNHYQVTDKFGVGLGLVYQDESYANNANTATLPSYARLDAAAYYQVSDKLRVQLNVENLTDELYFPYAHSTHQATVGAPINALLTIVGEF